jgi:hypothetical protein
MLKIDVEDNGMMTHPIIVSNRVGTLEYRRNSHDGWLVLR